MDRRPRLLIEPDVPQVADVAAERIVAWADEAIDARGQFTIALSGGSTPRPTYQRLASERHGDAIDWSRIHVFWSDDRCVPPTDRSSNHGMADEALLSRVPIPPDNVHRMRGELDSEVAAHDYEQELRRFFGGGWPRFDLVLLGLGSDGHTASLFPGSRVLDEMQRAVVAVEADYQDRPACRLTLTPRAINAARRVMFLVTGEPKAQVVREVLEGPTGRFPAQTIEPVNGELFWLLDAAAASKLSKRAEPEE
jgi:6-phosphogluconolactonase